jgi:hypothetical protein
MKAILAVTLMIFLAVLMGCAGTDQPETPEQSNNDVLENIGVSEGGETGGGETGSGETETGGSTEGIQGVQEWCTPGTSWTHSGSSEGVEGTTSFEIKGFEQYDGKTMCHAVATTDYGQQKMQMDYYFDESEETICYEMTDLNTGTKIGQGCVTE